MSSYLEARFPHIIGRLEHAWGNPCAFNEVFNDLIFDKRGGRSGWPEEAWAELDWLNQVHRLVCQKKDAPEPDEPIDDDIKWVS